MRETDHQRINVSQSLHNRSPHNLFSSGQAAGIKIIPPSTIDPPRPETFSKLPPFPTSLQPPQPISRRRSFLPRLQSSGSALSDQTEVSPVDSRGSNGDSSCAMNAFASETRPSISLQLKRLVDASISSPYSSANTSRDTFHPDAPSLPRDPATAQGYRGQSTIVPASRNSSPYSELGAGMPWSSAGSHSEFMVGFPGSAGEGTFLGNGLESHRAPFGGGQSLALPLAQELARENAHYRAMEGGGGLDPLPSATQAFPLGSTIAGSAAATPSSAFPPQYAAEESNSILDRWVQQLLVHPSSSSLQQPSFPVTHTLPAPAHQFGGNGAETHGPSQRVTATGVSHLQADPPASYLLRTADANHELTNGLALSDSPVERVVLHPSSQGAYGRRVSTSYQEGQCPTQLAAVPFLKAVVPCMEGEQRTDKGGSEGGGEGDPSSGSRGSGGDTHMGGGWKGTQREKVEAGEEEEEESEGEVHEGEGEAATGGMRIRRKRKSSMSLAEKMDKRKQCNRESARRSRVRKMNRLETLEIDNARLQVERKELTRQLTACHGRMQELQKHNEQLQAQLVQGLAEKEKMELVPSDRGSGEGSKE